MDYLLTHLMFWNFLILEIDQTSINCLPLASSIFPKSMLIPLLSSSSTILPNLSNRMCPSVATLISWENLVSWPSNISWSCILRLCPVKSWQSLITFWMALLLMEWKTSFWKSMLWGGITEVVPIFASFFPISLIWTSRTKPKTEIEKMKLEWNRVGNQPNLEENKVKK